MVAIRKIPCCVHTSSSSNSANSKKKIVSAELQSLVKAVKEARAHIIETDFGFHVHIGDRATYRPGACSIHMGRVAISANGVFNGNEHWIQVGDIRIPTDPDKIRHAVFLVETDVAETNKSKRSNDV